MSVWVGSQVPFANEPPHIALALIRLRSRARFNFLRTILVANSILACSSLEGVASLVACLRTFLIVMQSR